MSSKTLSLNEQDLYIDAALLVERVRSAYYIAAHEELRSSGFSYDRNAVTRSLNSCWSRISDIVELDMYEILATEEDCSLVISRWIDDDMVSHHFIKTFLRENAYRRGNPSLEKLHELFTRVHRTISGAQTNGVIHAGTV